MISIRDNKMRWAISAVLALLILFGTYRNVFSLAAFLIMGLMLVFCDRESNILQIFFVMPMANIFKLSPGVQSFFTVVLLIYVVLHLVLPRKSTLFVILFAVYVLLGQLFVGGFNLFRTIKLIGNILFLSSVLNNKVKLRSKEIFFSYIAGNIVSSIFGLLDSSFFKIVEYVGVEEFRNAEMEIDVSRFTGLYSDPNYYAIGLIVSLCLLVVMYFKDEINFLSVCLGYASIIYFLILTYSKSAILMLMVTFLFLLFALFKKRKFTIALLLIMLIVVVFVFTVSGAIPALDVVVSRFMAADTGTGIEINILTTGRFDLWISYVSYIFTNLKTLLFGDGISAELINARASHNTYLDVFYHLGLVGGILLVALFKSILVQSVQDKPKRNILNHSVLFCVAAMYLFLSELFYFDWPFHIFLVFMVMNIPFERHGGVNHIEDSGEKNEYVRV